MMDADCEMEAIQIIDKENTSIEKNLYRNYNNPYNPKTSKVIFYCPFNQSYTKMEKYDNKEISDLLMSYQKDNFFIIQIDNDNFLYEDILKIKFKSEFENIYKMFDLKLDYCFSPIDELLCFNLSVLTNIDGDEVEKFLIQIFLNHI